MGEAGARRRRFKGWDWTELAYRWGYRKPRRKWLDCGTCGERVRLDDPNGCRICGLWGDDLASHEFIQRRLAQIARDAATPGPTEADRQTVADLREFLRVLAAEERRWHPAGSGTDGGHAPLWEAMAAMPSDWHLLTAAIDLLGRMWT